MQLAVRARFGWSSWKLSGQYGDQTQWIVCGNLNGRDDAPAQWGVPDVDSMVQGLRFGEYP